MYKLARVRWEKNSSFATRFFFLGFANVLFCGLGVVDPNAPVRRKEWEGKIKTSCGVVGILRIYFWFFYFDFFKV